jgi:hypothetical protein
MYDNLISIHADFHYLKLLIESGTHKMERKVSWIRGDCYWLWRVLTYIVLQMKSKHIDSWTIKPKTLPNITLQELMLINIELIELNLIIITNIESLLNINHKPLKSEACNHCLLKENAIK